METPDQMLEFYICHHDSKRFHAPVDAIGLAQDSGYDTLTVPITTNVFQSRVTSLLSDYLHSSSLPDHAIKPTPTIPPLTAADTYLTPGNLVPTLLGVLSPWIDLCSPDPAVYDFSRQVLEMEVSFAAFCGLNVLVLPPPKSYGSPTPGHGLSQYAHVVRKVLELGIFMQFSVMMPMWDGATQFLEPSKSLAALARPACTSSEKDSRAASSDFNRRHDFLGTWDSWNVIRSLCNYSSRLSVGLQIPKLLPPSNVCSRWQSEPLRILFIDSSSFFANKEGYPALTVNHRALIHLYMRHPVAPCIVLTGVDPVPGTSRECLDPSSTSSSSPSGNKYTVSSSTGTEDNPTPAEAQAQKVEWVSSKALDKKGPLAHLMYLRWVQNNQPPKTHEDTVGTGYQDYLQVPLQPLKDNLESLTYEVFEKDPVKYDLYEEAIRSALVDWRDQKKPLSEHNQSIVIAVVGAGRGPLVDRAWKASKSAGVRIELWALEKNPSAFVLLQRHNAISWGNQVQLINSDMRSWKGPARFTGHTPPSTDFSEQITNSAPNNPPLLVRYPIDIVISELLGSLGDNELSPECLDGILPLLNPIHGISIPQSYSAYLTPIATPRLHTDILTKAANDSLAPNLPYVVMLRSFDYLANSSHMSAYGPDIATSPVEKGKRPSIDKGLDTTAMPSGEEGTPITRTPVPTVLQAWSFHHGPTHRLSPNSANTHNTRHTRLSFDIRHRGVCHGVAGYFEAILYPGVELSNNPINKDQKSPGMMSWFPIFFPLKTPLYAPDYSKLVVSMFRATDNRKVWYEWMVEAWSNHVGEKGGSGYRLGVSEFGSSKERGCLM